MSVESFETPPGIPPADSPWFVLNKFLRSQPTTSPSLQTPLVNSAPATTHITNAYFAETDAQLREALRDADNFQGLYTAASHRADRLHHECRQLRDAVHRLHRAHMADAKFNAAVIRDQAAEIDCLKQKLKKDDAATDSDAEYESFEQWEQQGHWHKEWVRLSQSDLCRLTPPQCLSETTTKSPDSSKTDHAHLSDS